MKYVTTYNGKVIRPKNQSQLKYYKLLENNTIIFAMGAAGTGKTYLAVAYGVSMLKIKKVSKMIEKMEKFHLKYIDELIEDENLEKEFTNAFEGLVELNYHLKIK